MTPAKQTLIRAAARNNAGWCAAVARSHGTASEFGPQAWTAPARTPQFYPDAVTLAPRADVRALVDRIDTAAPGASVKDSFADLDLTGHGFTVLFEAQWIHRPAGPPDTPPQFAWSAVRDPETLREWALAWADGGPATEIFRPGLLEDRDTAVIAGRSADGWIAAGAVASRSATVVGVSNLFATGGDTDSAWPVALEAAHTLFPGLPAVGYEHGDDLASARRHGFEPIGPLRIWLRGH